MLLMSNDGVRGWPLELHQLSGYYQMTVFCYRIAFTA